MFVEFHSWGTGVFEHNYGLLCVFDLNAMSHVFWHHDNILQLKWLL